MADQYPRVVSLTYRIIWDEAFQYVTGAELEGELPGFHFRLRDHDAIFTSKMHISSEQDARQLLEPELRAWEMDAALTLGSGAIAFRFLASHVQRAAPGAGVAEGSGVVAFGFAPKAKGVSVLHRHPEPPANFALDEFAQTLGELLLLSRGTPITLLYVAYSMFTLLEQRYGTVEQASKALGISANVLKTVSRISNSRGRGAAARKHIVGQQHAELSAAESQWLKAALLLIVRRAGAAVGRVQVNQQITLADLPPLPMA